METYVEPQNVQRNPRGEIIFKLNQKLHFIATKTFTLGAANVQIRAEADVYFDGTKAEIDGMEYNAPSLRGPVKQRWLVLAEEFEGIAYNRPVSANISVRSATQMGNPMMPENNRPTARFSIATTENDEREVGSVSSHAHQTRNGNKNYVRGQGVNVVPPGTRVRTQHGVMEVELQDGEVVEGRTLKTAAGEKSKNTRINAEYSGEVLRQAASVQIEAGQGISQDEMLARMTPEQQEDYLQSKSAYRGQYVSDEPTPVRRTVGRVAASAPIESSGFRVTTSVGGGTEISDGDGEIVGRVGDKQETFEQEGVRFTTTNGPRRQQPPARLEPAPAPRIAGPSAEVRKKIAKAICADFPDNYLFELSSKKKLARITADYEDRPDVLQAIFAAEDDEMKSLLVKEFPAVFGV